MKDEENYKIMKPTKIIASILFVFGCMTMNGQQYDQQTVTFGIASHSLVGVNTPTLAFSFVAPTSAGNGLVAQTASASTNLYYSFMPSTPVNGASNGAKIKVNFINIPSGISVDLTVDDQNISSLPSATYGDLGNVVSGFQTGQTIGTGAVDIINGIGASYTGTNYYILTYTATIDDYTDLSSSPNGGTPTIMYTITQ